MKFLQQLCSLVLLIGMVQFGFAQSNVTVTAPAGIAGDYVVEPAAFGNFPNAESASIVLIDDGTGVSNGCVAADNAAALAGNIAMIDRGACGFAVKVGNAEMAGAIAVIICNNNVAEPDAVIVMGNGGNCVPTLPTVMMSYNNCLTLKAELANGLAGSMPATTPYPTSGEDVTTAISLPGAGTYTATELTGIWGVYDVDGPKAQIYSITAPDNLVMNVNSCLNGVDTRLTILQGCRGSLILTGHNDDFCELTPGGNTYASNLDVLVNSGEQYLIHWDNRWTDSGFDFDVSFSALQDVAVTFTVDASQTTVNGNMRIAGSFNGWNQEDMMDNGDGTWSATYTILQGSDVQYKFLNGVDGWEASAELGTCGVDDGFGGFNRVYSVGVDAVQVLGTVCLSSCTVCPPPACSDPDAIICDDFEDYTLGLVSGQSAHFLPWSLTPGGADDAAVSDAQAASGTQSLLVSAANGDDLLLLLGDQTTGNYLLQWKMFIPTGNTGYFNIQKIEGTPAGEFGTQVFLNADGTATVDAGGAAAATGTWTPNAWMDVVMYYDLDNDWVSMYFDGVEIYSFPASHEALAAGGIIQLGAVNFFGNTNTVQYIDDILFKALPACPDDAVICDSYEAYVSGSTTGGQAPWWTTWSGAWGTAEDGIVSSEQVFDGSNSMQINGDNVQDVLLTLGDQTEGHWRLEWQMYIPQGHNAYYNIQEFEGTPGGQFNMEIFLNSTAANPPVYNQGMGVLSTGETFTVPEDEWFSVVNIIDLDNGTHTLMIAGNMVLDQVDYAGDQIGAIDFFGFGPNHLAYYDAIRFIELAPVSPDPVDVTFHVNMANVPAANPAFIAGSFNGWAGEAMTDNGDLTYSFTVAIAPGTEVQYKFQNGLNGWETGIPAECSVAPDGNRAVTVGDVALEIPIVCFQECADCMTISVDEKDFASALNVYPNPTSNNTQVIYNFNETVDLNITVSNTIGQQLYNVSLGAVQQGVHDIDLKNFATGVYFIQMTDGTNNLTKRLVVE
jgi:Secretion system C-terminal sorting domain/PA domain